MSLLDGAGGGASGVALIPAGEIRQKRMVYTPVLFGLLVALSALGLLNLYSATGGNELFFVQLRHYGVGLIAFLFCAFVVHPRHLNTYAYWLYGIIAILLLAVLVIGHAGGGAQRWIVLGPIRMQPSEPAKIIVAIVTARFFFLTRMIHPYRLRDLWPVLAMNGLIFALIFPEPDFGTAGFVLMIVAVQLAFVRLDWRSVGLVAGSAIAILPILWHFLLMDYQKARILSFLNPTLDPHGKGYNALQSLVAIGSGGFAGKGWLQGTQTQLQFLPMRHTDFAFSVFAEEHGFWGGVILFLLFAAVAYVALEIAREAKDVFNSLLAIGLGAFIFLEFTINIAMVLRMFPVVGLPLPFFTYGGSALLTVCVAMGLLVSIDRDTHGRSRRPGSLSRA